MRKLIRTGIGQMRAGIAGIAAAAALAGADAAGAASFVLVHTEAEKITVMDPAAIEAVGDGTVKRAWSVSVQKNLVSGGPPQPGYIRTLNEYDCARKQVRWRSFFVYSRFGALMMHQDNADEAWRPPSDVLEAQAGLAIVCRGVGDSDVVAAPSMSRLVIGLLQNWDEATPLPDPPPITTKTPQHRARDGRR